MSFSQLSLRLRHGQFWLMEHEGKVFKGFWERSSALIQKEEMPVQWAFPFLPVWALLLADMILKAAAGDREKEQLHGEVNTEFWQRCSNSKLHSPYVRKWPQFILLLTVGMSLTSSGKDTWWPTDFSVSKYAPFSQSPLFIPLARLFLISCVGYFNNSLTGLSASPPTPSSVQLSLWD